MYEFVNADDPASETLGSKCETHGTIFERLVMQGVSAADTADAWGEFAHNKYNSDAAFRGMVTMMEWRLEGRLTRKGSPQVDVLSRQGHRLSIMTRVALIQFHHFAAYFKKLRELHNRHSDRTISPSRRDQTCGLYCGRSERHPSQLSDVYGAI